MTCNGCWIFIKEMNVNKILHLEEGVRLTTATNFLKVSWKPGKQVKIKQYSGL